MEYISKINTTDGKVRNIRDDEARNYIEEVKQLAQEAIRLGRSTIVSDTQPDKQSNGDLWLDTSEGESEYGENGIVIANAVVSDTEPENGPDLWLHTHQ